MSVVTIIRRSNCSWDRRESVTTSRSIRDGFLQVCGSSHLREMQIISDQISSLKMYRLCCNCSFCLSFSKSKTVDHPPATEPFMNAVNLVFNTLAKFDYELKSTSTTQNVDESSSMTWVWVKKILYEDR